MSVPSTTIGIAVVEDRRRFLVGTRNVAGPLPSRAEFPGGKCQGGESPCDAAVRECLEETGLAVVPVKLLLRLRFHYSHGGVELHFWLCRPIDAAQVTDEHRGFQWIDVEHLVMLDFPVANAPVVAMLVAGSAP